MDCSPRYVDYYYEDHAKIKTFAGKKENGFFEKNQKVLDDLFGEYLLEKKNGCCDIRIERDIEEVTCFDDFKKHADTLKSALPMSSEIGVCIQNDNNHKNPLVLDEQTEFHKLSLFGKNVKNDFKVKFYISDENTGTRDLEENHKNHFSSKSVKNLELNKIREVEPVGKVKKIQLYVGDEIVQMQLSNEDKEGTKGVAFTEYMKGNGDSHDGSLVLKVNEKSRILDIDTKQETLDRNVRSNGIKVNIDTFTFIKDKNNLDMSRSIDKNLDPNLNEELKTRFIDDNSETSVFHGGGMIPGFEEVIKTEILYTGSEDDAFVAKEDLRVLNEEVKRNVDKIDADVSVKKEGVSLEQLPFDGGKRLSVGSTEHLIFISAQRNKVYRNMVLRWRRIKKKTTWEEENNGKDSEGMKELLKVRAEKHKEVEELKNILMLHQAELDRKHEQATETKHNKGAMKKQCRSLQKELKHNQVTFLLL